MEEQGDVRRETRPECAGERKDGLHQRARGGAGSVTGGGADGEQVGQGGIRNRNDVKAGHALRSIVCTRCVDREGAEE